jgi:hypothetical protein
MSTHHPIQHPARLGSPDRRKFDGQNETFQIRALDPSGFDSVHFRWTGSSPAANSRKIAARFTFA